MGGRGVYINTGGFTRRDYRHTQIVGEIKLVEKKSKGSGLPQFSNTANTRYWGVDKNGNINQLRIFRGRKAVIDIDFGHANIKGVAGDIHAHLWVNGRRGGEHRTLSQASIRRYGKLFEAANNYNRRKR